ncbi:hypothetical protein PMG71_05675 [Roseofilum sp. BLCC_M154]|uniref:ABC transmembrane type-1 domain-containing protein n=1 Tax=Roseofilum acuticapitatum BLCC-M154 TaxID=3022444 RepID=A0ABT7APV6_9CYAN|nr:hypothetical protein [Roseofilum acuticapitatum]MDJ1168909.1 hypothetical protein [Roseofilum acuticapitatum BLCC-M154]
MKIINILRTSWLHLEKFKQRLLRLPFQIVFSRRFQNTSYSEVIMIILMFAVGVKLFGSLVSLIAATSTFWIVIPGAGILVLRVLDWLVALAVTWTIGSLIASSRGFGLAVHNLLRELDN